MTCTYCKRRAADAGYKRCALCRLEERLRVARWREARRIVHPLSMTRAAIYMRGYRRGFRKRGRYLHG